MTAPARIAALPMYDADRGAVDAWWRAIAAACRAEGIAGVPSALDWPTDLDAHWRDPRLLLGQACGAPLVDGLADAVQVVGAFGHTAEGCTGIDYRSRLVARCRDAGASAAAARAGQGSTLADFRGRVAAVNDPGSHSGCMALLEAVAALAGDEDDDGPFFSATVVSGSHRASLHLVRSGAADIAAIDCVTHAGIARATPQALDGLATIGWTPSAPGLPLITSAATPPGDLAALQRALAAACRDPRLADVRAALSIGRYAPVASDVWLSRMGTRAGERVATGSGRRQRPP